MRDKCMHNYITIHRTNGRTFSRKSPKYLTIYVPDLRDRGNCVRIPRRRRVGCFLLPVVSVIRSLLFTNESRGLDVIVNLHVQRRETARHAAQIKTIVFISVLFPQEEKLVSLENILKNNYRYTSLEKPNKKR